MRPACAYVKVRLGDLGPADVRRVLSPPPKVRAPPRQASISLAPVSSERVACGTAACTTKLVGLPIAERSIRVRLGGNRRASSWPIATAVEQPRLRSVGWMRLNAANARKKKGGPVRARAARDVPAPPRPPSRHARHRRARSHRFHRTAGTARRGSRPTRTKIRPTDTARKGREEEEEEAAEADEEDKEEEED